MDVNVHGRRSLATQLSLPSLHFRSPSGHPDEVRLQEHETVVPSRASFSVNQKASGGAEEPKLRLTPTC